MRHLPKILSSLIIATFAGVLIAHAAETSYVPLAPLPIGEGGATPSSYTMSTYLSGALKLLIALGGALSILMAIIGGTQYVAASINPSAKKDALERIQNALIGLAIILTSYLLLNSINPKLVGGGFLLAPVAGVAPTAPVVVGVVCPTPNDTSASCCPSGLNCNACNGCSLVPANIPNKGCGAGKTCFLSTTILSKIQNITPVSGWRITESWPPTVNHISLCHQEGTCADMNNSGGQTDPATIKTYYDAFKAAGLTVIYENPNCAPYIAVGVNCGSYETQTNGSSFHVR